MSQRIIGFHHSLKAVILLGFAVYVALLAKSGNILLYIAPKMTDYVKISALLLYIVAIYQLYLGVRAFTGKAMADCDCEHDHTPSPSILKNTAIYGLFLLPLVLGFLLPDTMMGSNLAAKKGMNLNSAAALKKDSPAAAGMTKNSASTDLSVLFPSDKFTKPYADYAKKLYSADVIQVKEELFMETLSTLDLYLDRFVGKKLQLTGFVYRQDDMKSNQFVVGRFSVQCCSADGAPFGVLAEYDRAPALASDSWVTVTGTIQKTRFNDNDILVLKVEQVAKAEPAKTAYVYPNYDFGS